jgi:hypothetical protein
MCFCGGGYAGDLSPTTVSVMVTVSAIETVDSPVSEVSSVTTVLSLTTVWVAAANGSTAISASSTGGVVFSSVARLLSFWRMGLSEFVGEMESGGCPFPWPLPVGVEAWGMLCHTQVRNEAIGRQ